LISKSLREVFGEVAVTAGLMIAGSDSRHYGQITDNAYRFNPFKLTQAELAGFLGTKEKMRVADFVMRIKAYFQVISHGVSA